MVITECPATCAPACITNVVIPKSIFGAAKKAGYSTVTNNGASDKIREYVGINRSRWSRFSAKENTKTVYIRFRFQNVPNITTPASLACLKLKGAKNLDTFTAIGKATA
jgi:hypothetical protein